MDWAEHLPENCPPNDANPPNNELYFRLIEAEEPTEFDFYSHRHRWPGKKFNLDECRARSLSIWDKFSECKNLLRLQIHKNKKIIQIQLPEDSGVIKQTGGSVHHFSWWRLKSFNAYARGIL